MEGDVAQQLANLRQELQLHQRVCGTLYDRPRKTPIWATAAVSALVSGGGVVAIVWWSLQPRIEAMLDKAMSSVLEDVREIRADYKAVDRRLQDIEQRQAEARGADRALRGRRVND